MASENPIYIKFDYQEALQSKRDILTSQMDLLKTARTINSYKTYRSEELGLKSKFLKSLKELKTSLGRLQRILPKPRIPEILKREDYIGKEQKKVSEIKPHDVSLEEQLQEIQRKLNELQR